MSSIQEEIQKLSPSAIIVLYEFDLDPEDAPGTNVMRFHNGTNKLGGPIVWNGNSYAAWPIEVSGFKAATQGTLPVLKVRISNGGGMLSSLATNFESLYKACLIRRRTFARFLDAANFPGGINPDANPSMEMPQDLFYFSRPAAVNKEVAELEFRMSFDVDGVYIPRRAAFANTCYWQYRDASCGYMGVPVATQDGTPITPTPDPVSAPYSLWSNTTAYVPGNVVGYHSQRRVFVCKTAHTGKDPGLESSKNYWVEDRCGKCLADCRLRFGSNPLPYGGFPGLLRVPQV